MSSPAGWREQPDGRERWWDGDSWTEHYRGQPYEPERAAPEKRRNGRPRLVVLGAVVAAAALLLGGLALANRPTPLEAAGEKCKKTLSVSDGGHTMQLHTLGEDPQDIDITTFATIDDVKCVLDALEVPDYVRSHMDSTRALDGQQTDEWDDLSARWTYHPDEGFHLTFRTK